MSDSAPSASPPPDPATSTAPVTPESLGATLERAPGSAPFGSAREERTARVGILLFVVYFALYAGFMALSVTHLDILGGAFGGANVAIWYGFGLILAALGLAFLYMWLCRDKTGFWTVQVGSKQEGDA